MEEGSKNVRLGSLIGLLVEEGQDWKQVEIPADASDPSSLAPPAAAPTSTPASPSVSAPPPKLEHLPGKLQWVSVLIMKWNTSSVASVELNQEEYFFPSYLVLSYCLRECFSMCDVIKLAFSEYFSACTPKKSIQATYVY